MQAASVDGGSDKFMVRVPGSPVFNIARRSCPGVSSTHIMSSISDRLKIVKVNTPSVTPPTSECFRRWLVICHPDGGLNLSPDVVIILDKFFDPQTSLTAKESGNGPPINI